jgi:hypothetical protein
MGIMAREAGRPHWARTLPPSGAAVQRINHHERAGHRTRAANLAATSREGGSGDPTGMGRASSRARIDACSDFRNDEELISEKHADLSHLDAITENR